MNRQTRNNRPKRLRIAANRTGIAQPRVNMKGYSKTVNPFVAATADDATINAWYDQIENQAKSTGKTTRVGNYYEKVRNGKYTKLVPKSHNYIKHTNTGVSHIESLVSRLQLVINRGKAA